ncbi:putative FAD dependent oxidoreductase [Phlyctema vagabunda]|uniref:FAD dependent oxidoreductase n=1 Tax=Phlyctema vagabunda TaxID=108571 RepID=A0ABR4PC35_9HELO
MPESIGIIGAGITGLACASVLCSKYDVTIVARDLPGDLGTDWASPWAGAVFHPQKTTDRLKQEMQTIAFKHYWALAHTDPASGVKVFPMTEYFDEDLTSSDATQEREKIWYRSLMPNYRIIATEDLPSGTDISTDIDTQPGEPRAGTEESRIRSGIRYATVAINPLLYLPWLSRRLQAQGVRLVRQTVSSLAEARTATGAARVLINCAGVGAGALARDDSVVPVRGQTMFVRTRAFGELVMRESASEYTYVIPRVVLSSSSSSSLGSRSEEARADRRLGTETEIHGVILGGIKSTRRDTAVDQDLKHDILRRVNRITGNAFAGLDLDPASSSSIIDDIVGFRPGRTGGKGLRVERVDGEDLGDGDGKRDAGVVVVHAYGVEGAGYIYSFGIAERVRWLIEGGERGERAFRAKL